MPFPCRCSTVCFTTLCVTLAANIANGQDQLPAPAAQTPVAQSQSSALPPEAPNIPNAHVYPINLPTALQLAGVEPLDIAVASERLKVACAQLDRARVLWLPNVNVGVDYFRHDGRIQDVRGDVFDTSKSSVMAGAGPSRKIYSYRTRRHERDRKSTRLNS